MALEELHTVLAVFTLYEERTGDIIELLRYAYENTSELSNGSDHIRALLALYIGFEMDTLLRDQAFRDLILDVGGALSEDFMEMVASRIN